MANVYKGTLGLIGNTPLVEVVNVEKEQRRTMESFRHIIQKIEEIKEEGYWACIHCGSKRI